MVAETSLAQVDQIAEQAVHSQKLAQKMVDTATKQALMAHVICATTVCDWGF